MAKRDIYAKSDLKVTVLEEPQTPSSCTTLQSPLSCTTLGSSDPTKYWNDHFAQHPAKVTTQVLDYSARHWGSAKKILASLVAIASFFVITLATSIYIGGISEIRVEFHVGSTLAISPVTLYAIGFTIGPLLSSALSEEFGRQWALKGSLLLHLVFTIVGATASNFRTMAVSRALCGILGSPLVTILVGVLNDIWKLPEDRLAVPIFFLYGLGGIAAPTVGPIIGESIVGFGGWRWTFWLITALDAVCFLAALTIGETYEPEVRRKALGLPRCKWRKVLGPALRRPFHMLWVEPIIFPTTSITVAGQVVLFVLYAAFPIMLKEVYGFSSYQTGLAFLPQLVAGVLAFLLLAFIEERRRATVEDEPEFILVGGKLAGTAMWTSLIILAWLPRHDVHCAWALLASAVFGFGFALSQLVYARYKNEVYGAELGASVLAIDVAMRYGVSSVFPLFTIQFVERVGFHWVMSVFAAIHLSLWTVPWALQKHGAALRQKSRYVNCRSHTSEDVIDGKLAA
ncbi:MFS general substrate transporter [Penicillium nucicola]|uniref:MFS general substrate transporter n=1 Tax=Penicillium nucicola TaxID=1850975 RepID=UPI0025455DA6|nr:MFS general substrate transporter [Penicillium nucicola]KAJ5751536.1 MFS general substrate transporter [Penicillium nucicola]